MTTHDRAVGRNAREVRAIDAAQNVTPGTAERMKTSDGTATTSKARLTLETWHLFVSAIRNFLTSEVGGQAAMMLGLLLVLLLGINSLNVVNSYVGRDFMSAIERRDQPEFVRQTVRYLVVFGALTTAAVLS